MSEHYCVMYHGENLYSYQMTEYDISLVEDLRKECMVICETLDIPRARCFDGSLWMGRLKDSEEFILKHKTGIGYFILDGERGIFSMRKGFPEQVRERAKFRILKGEFSGHQYELEHRKILQCDWNKKYNIEYDSRKAAFEFEIKKHIEACSCLVEEIIMEHTEHMNRWFERPRWFYDRDSMCFEEKSIAPV